MAGITTLNGSISDSLRWSASNDILGQQPLTQGDNVATTYNFGTGFATTASGGADELASFLQVIAPGGSATINLQSITNILQQVGIALARLKGYKIRLLAASGRGAIDSVNGTTCSSIQIGNAASNVNRLEMGADAHTYRINNGGSHQHFDPSAAGFVAVTTTTRNILITNNDASIAAAVQVTLIGATT